MLDFVIHSVMASAKETSEESFLQEYCFASVQSWIDHWIETLPSRCSNKNKADCNFESLEHCMIKPLRRTINLDDIFGPVTFFHCKPGRIYSVRQSEPG